MFGGVTTGKLAEVTCDVDDPNALRFCDQRPTKPYLTQMKLAWSYPVPFGLNFAGTVQSYPDAGVDSQGNNHLQVNYNVGTAIIPTLTQTSVIVPLNAAGSKYLPRLTKLDLRFGKTVQLDRYRLSLNFDMFNALNSHAIMQSFQTFGNNLICRMRSAGPAVPLRRQHDVLKPKGSLKAARPAPAGRARAPVGATTSIEGLFRTAGFLPRFPLRSDSNSRPAPHSGGVR